MGGIQSIIDNPNQDARPIVSIPSPCYVQVNARHGIVLSGVDQVPLIGDHWIIWHPHRNGLKEIVQR